ncbi:MAG: hypothetical protein CVU57_23595 [Deltaproteobacteria bacterium HGW-Deltaproteobacteria-15]|nr:MAG: hypothetical protein CVU57_23595 [Deltaproteobacteria bacterium HGW-Deltaproteobacteria-15]
MEEYLTVDELSARIKFSKQSLYNLIHRGAFVLGKHYLKPTPKKVLFKWSEVKHWIGDASSPNDGSTSNASNTNAAGQRCLINI